mmetsp:Transcript_33966/g.86847  ORF Transcript_33966/g.86847 Transcript_33966/m.86847 type:complete len:224 (+) Transcript_33966:1748-2419(+)
MPAPCPLHRLPAYVPVYAGGAAGPVRDAHEEARRREAVHPHALLLRVAVQLPRGQAARHVRAGLEVRQQRGDLGPAVGGHQRAEVVDGNTGGRPIRQQRRPQLRQVRQGRCVCLCTAATRGAYIRVPAPGVGEAVQSCERAAGPARERGIALRRADQGDHDHALRLRAPLGDRGAHFGESLTKYELASDIARGALQQAERSGGRVAESAFAQAPHQPVHSSLY